MIKKKITKELLRENDDRITKQKTNQSCLDTVAILCLHGAVALRQRLLLKT